MRGGRLVVILASLVAAALCSGCSSVVLQYSEQPLCRKGVYGGYCASMTEVYDEVSKDLKQNRKYRGPALTCDGTNCN